MTDDVRNKPLTLYSLKVSTSIWKSRQTQLRRIRSPFSPTTIVKLPKCLSTPLAPLYLQMKQCTITMLTSDSSQQPTIPLPVCSMSSSRVHPCFRNQHSLTKLSRFWFLNAILDDEIQTIIIIMILVAADFWTVKNITGRILVGLRWWCQIDENGNEKWVYESREDQVPQGKTDSFVFWTWLYVTPVVWAVFAVLELLSFKPVWVMTAIICGVMSGTNFLGYYKCSKDQQNKLSQMQGKAMGFAITNLAKNYMPKIPFFGNRS